MMKRVIMKPRWRSVEGIEASDLCDPHDVSPFEEVSELITPLSLSSTQLPQSLSTQHFPSALSSSPPSELLGHVGIALPALIVSLSLCHPS